MAKREEPALWRDVHGVRIEMTFDSALISDIREALADFLADTKNLRDTCTVSLVHEVPK